MCDSKINLYNSIYPFKLIEQSTNKYILDPNKDLLLSNNPPSIQLLEYFKNNFIADIETTPYLKITYYLNYLKTFDYTIEYHQCTDYPCHLNTKKFEENDSVSFLALKEHTEILKSENNKLKQQIEKMLNDLK